MFTGIIDGIGRVRKVQKKSRVLSLQLQVPAAYRRLKLGSSVAVDGVCLTVVSAKKGVLAFDVVSETLKRSRLGRVQTGDRLNLELPLRWMGRVDGHLVQGHVDGLVKVLKVVPRGKARDFYVMAPKKFSRFLTEKGSVALNGVSLTLGRKKEGSFWVHVIPHTLKKTNLGLLKAGDTLNLETDAWLKARFR